MNNMYISNVDQLIEVLKSGQVERVYARIKLGDKHINVTVEASELLSEIEHARPDLTNATIQLMTKTLVFTVA